MNAKKMYLSVFLGVLLLSSCKTARDMVSENDICGEWNVVEIQGEPVRAQSNPFIGFDTKKGRVYGYSGCNRIMGSLDLSRDNKIELGHMASTLKYNDGLSRYGIGRKTYRSVVYGKER